MIDHSRKRQKTNKKRVNCRENENLKIEEEPSTKSCEEVLNRLITLSLPKLRRLIQQEID